MSALMDQLRQRKRPSYGYPLRVAEPEETAAAEAEVTAARRVVDMLKMQKEPDQKQKKKAEKDLKAAEEKRDACYVKIPLMAMPPKRFEELQDEFPEAEGGDKKAAREADEGYLTAVFLESVDSDDTAEQWEAFFEENVSTGERNELFNAALNLNGHLRVPNSNVPKG